MPATVITFIPHVHICFLCVNHAQYSVGPTAISHLIVGLLRKTFMISKFALIHAN
jgi:hypothetical protein